MGMREFAGERRFDQEQLVKAAAEFLVTEGIGPHQLDGHLAARESIVGQVDRAGGTPAELLDDLVFADLVHERSPGDLA